MYYYRIPTAEIQNGFPSNLNVHIGIRQNENFLPLLFSMSLYKFKVGLNIGAKIRGISFADKI